MLSEKTIIWPSETQVVSKNGSFFYKNEFLPVLLRKLITWGRISSITICLVYYLTYNYLVPNLELISKQRKMFCLQNILCTRHLLNEIAAKSEQADHKKLTHRAKLMVQLDTVSKLTNKIKTSNINTKEVTEDFGSLVCELKETVAAKTEKNRAESQTSRKLLAEQAAQLKETVRALQRAL